jgi:TPR repeat protein/Zn-dependent protease with chaperone function
VRAIQSQESLSVRIFVRAVIFLCALLASHAFAQQQQRLLWDAKRLLSVQSPTINLTFKGQRVDNIARSDVVQAIEITERLSASLGISSPEVLVTHDRAPNAFVTYNNQRQPVMAVNTEMFRLVDGDENKLAAVIGHELGHLKANHLTEGRNAKIAINIIGALLGAAVDISQARRGNDTGGVGTLLGSAGGALVSAAYNRDQEREADQLGQQAMASAGYDPLAVPKLWQLMAVRGPGRSGLWFDSHPSAPEREQRASAAAQELRPIYETNSLRFDDERLRNALAIGDADPFPAARHVTLSPTDLESVAGSPYARGRKALENQEFEEAKRLFKEASAADDERATYMIGLMTARGDGGPADPAAALTLFNLSAESGFNPAIAAIGNAAFFGHGREKDFTEALRLYRVAARRGYEPAAATLAYIYAEGTAAPHVARDRRVAKLLAERSTSTLMGKAILGTLLRDGSDPARGVSMLEEVAPRLPYARYQLGYAYEHGLGTAQDHARAATEYEKAAVEGNAAAKARLQSLSGR